MNWKCGKNHNCLNVEIVSFYRLKFRNTLYCYGEAKQFKFGSDTSSIPILTTNKQLHTLKCLISVFILCFHKNIAIGYFVIIMCLWRRGLTTST